MNCRVVPSHLVHCCSLVPDHARQRPTSSSPHDDHDHFDSDDTLSTSAGYDFMNEVSPQNTCQSLVFSNLSLSRPQSPPPEILIIIVIFVIMPNTLKNVLLVSWGVSYHYSHAYNAETWKAVPAPLDIPSFI